jgi:hypothetical protein
MVNTIFYYVVLRIFYLSAPLSTNLQKSIIIVLRNLFITREVLVICRFNFLRRMSIYKNTTQICTAHKIICYFCRHNINIWPRR